MPTCPRRWISCSFIGRKILAAHGWGQIALNGSATFLFLTPVAYLGFSALNRPQARLLTAAYLLASGSLLIPVRHGLPVTTVLIAVASLVLWVDSRFIAGSTVGGTGEGLISRLLLLLPVGVVAARTAFYRQSDLFVGITTMLLGLLLFVMLPRFVKEETKRTRMQAFSTAPIVLGWGVISFRYFPIAFNTTAVGPLVTLLPLSAMLTLLSWRSFGGGDAYRKVASLLTLLALLISLYGSLHFPGGNRLPLPRAGGLLDRDRRPAFRNRLPPPLCVAAVYSQPLGIVGRSRHPHSLERLLHGEACGAHVRPIGAVARGHEGLEVALFKKGNPLINKPAGAFAPAGSCWGNR